MAASLSGYKTFSKIPLIPAQKPVADETITAFLAIAKRVLKSIMGFPESENLPDDDTAVDQAVYLIAKFYLENRDFQERVTQGEVEPFQETKTQYFRSQLKPAVLKQALGWVYHLAKPENFIPKVETQTGGGS